MKSICGADCDKCESFVNNKCKGCKMTNACPFGKKCFIANYIEIGDKKSFEEFKKVLIDELNSLKIEGMPTINELYPLNGKFVNLEYTLPNNKKVKLLDDNDIYLGNQLKCEFDNEKCFGVLANMNFLLVCEYGDDGNNSEVIIYKRR